MHTGAALLQKAKNRLHLVYINQKASEKFHKLGYDFNIVGQNPTIRHKSYDVLKNIEVKEINSKKSFDNTHSNRIEIESLVGEWKPPLSVKSRGKIFIYRDTINEITKKSSIEYSLLRNFTEVFFYAVAAMHTFQFRGKKDEFDNYLERSLAMAYALKSFEPSSLFSPLIEFVLSLSSDYSFAIQLAQKYDQEQLALLLIRWKREKPKLIRNKSKIFLDSLKKDIQ